MKKRIYANLLLLMLVSASSYGQSDSLRKLNYEKYLEFLEEKGESESDPSRTLQVTPVSDALVLAQTLMGNGVMVQNAFLDCGEVGAGTFDGTMSNIGLSDGIILTTGDAEIAEGPNDSPVATGVNNVNPSGDPDLELLSTNGIFGSYDACVLEFDVIPTGDVIKLQYVYGSEEYPESVCSLYEDIMGIFVSGPGIMGPFGDNAINIAYVPNTNLPISNNTINVGMEGGEGSPEECGGMGAPGLDNVQYFIDNVACGGQSVQYDGFTTVISSVVDVMPTETYHIKIAIHDGFDPFVDAGILLKGQSLISCMGPAPIPNFMVADSTTTIPVNFVDASTAVEPGATYDWDFDGDGVFDLMGVPPGDQTFTFTQGGKYRPLLCITNPNGCRCCLEQQITITEPDFDCETCITSFSPLQGKKYVLSAWVKENTPTPVKNYAGPTITLEYPSAGMQGPFLGKGNIIDGWQRVEEEFVVPPTANVITIQLNNVGSNEVFFDDIRIHPFDANMKSFVYDPVTLRLTAELDENNYATFYDYDEEGKLIRVKKETQDGIRTIQESRENTFKDLGGDTSAETWTGAGDAEGIDEGGDVSNAGGENRKKGDDTKDEIEKGGGDNRGQRLQEEEKQVTDKPVEEGRRLLRGNGMEDPAKKEVEKTFTR